MAIVLLWEVSAQGHVRASQRTPSYWPVEGRGHFNHLNLKVSLWPLKCQLHPHCVHEVHPFLLPLNSKTLTIPVLPFMSHLQFIHLPSSAACFSWDSATSSSSLLKFHNDVFIRLLLPPEADRGHVPSVFPPCFNSHLCELRLISLKRLLMKKSVIVNTVHLTGPRDELLNMYVKDFLDLVSWGRKPNLNVLAPFSVLGPWTDKKKMLNINHLLPGCGQVWPPTSSSCYHFFPIMKGCTLKEVTNTLRLYLIFLQSQTWRFLSTHTTFSWLILRPLSTPDFICK